jgi:DNA-binding response OmpR family regulator
MAEKRKKDVPRIIIADDDDCFTQILQIVLERAGMEVVKITTTGRQAIGATLEYKPDCLLLDVAMPDMDGLAALANIKFLAPQIPVIIVSMLKDPHTKIRALELAADAFFSKEGSMEELIAVICAHVSKECAPLPPKINADPIYPTVPRFHLIYHDPNVTVT